MYTDPFFHDAMNRLVKVIYSGSARSEFSYDSFGRRVKIVEKDSSGSVTSTKQFVFDGWAAVEQRDGGNAVTKRYFKDGFRDVTNSQSYYYTKDHLGSIREVMGSDGTTIAARYDYDPYGRVTKVSGSVDSDFLYTGYYIHVQSGIYLSPTRAYAAYLGRFISRDPLESVTGEMPEMTQGPNLYQYVANNPINLFDPLGLVDYNYFHPSDGLKQTYDNYNPKNEISVASHGNMNGGIYDSNTNKFVDVKDLAEQIRKNPKFADPKIPIKLYSCDSGSGPNSVAQKLANELKRDVIGANGPVHANEGMDKFDSFIVGPQIWVESPSGSDQWLTKSPQ
ncbi:hypothetical protein BH09VER1_BH09VER1_25170 [soil metagenome]